MINHVFIENCKITKQWSNILQWLFKKVIHIYNYGYYFNTVKDYDNMTKYYQMAIDNGDIKKYLTMALLNKQFNCNTL